MLRELAERHEMPVGTLEDIHQRFLQVDTDSSGVIDKSEFKALMLKLHGANHSSDIPDARMHFFWQNADRDCSGEIDFPEFVRWFHMFFFSPENLDASGHVSSIKIVENFYSSSVCKRTISHCTFAR